MNPLERRELCREMRKRQTPAEEFFWELVRDRRFCRLKFRRQHPLGSFVADFYCPELRLVVELDGGVHQNQKGRDQARDQAIYQRGVRVLRIKNADILEHPEEALENLRSTFITSPSPSNMERGLGG